MMAGVAALVPGIVPVLVTASIAGGCAPQSSGPGDIVLFGVDTVRYDHTSLAGYERDTTPELQDWAAGGTVFERAYSGSSWTLPSVAMLFSGRLRSTNSGDLPTTTPTLPDLTRFAGYDNRAVVGNSLLSAEKGYAQRFDGFELYAVGEPHGRNSWPGSQIVARGLQALDESAEPTFLWLWLFDPHDPYRPRRAPEFQSFDDRARQARFASAVPEAADTPFDPSVYVGIEARIARYDSELREADAAFGELLAGLRERGRLESSTIIFVSDHGEGLWQRPRLTGEPDKPNAYYPDLYFDHGVMLYEEQVRVPLVFAGPGVPAGRRSDPVHLIDVVPTLCSLLDLDDPGTFDGVDLFSGDELLRPLAAFTSRGSSLLALGRYRIHVPREYRVDRFQAQPELYDLEMDPLELEPLDDAARMESLAASLEVLRELGAQRGGTRTMSAIEQQTLRDLGYVGGEADQVPAEGQ